DALLHLLDRGCQLKRFVLGGAQEVEGEALSRTLADAGQASQLRHEVLHGRREHVNTVRYDPLPTKTVGSSRRSATRPRSRGRSSAAAGVYGAGGVAGGGGGEGGNRGFPDVSEARKAERAERAAQLRLGERLRRAQRLVHGGEDGVLEQLRVVGVDRLRVDVDLLDLSGAGRLHGDEPAAGRGLDHLLRQLLLRLLHLCLHLLRLPEQLVHVEALARHQSSTSRASNVSL